MSDSSVQSERNPVAIISASAGTGKTTRLARLICEAVDDGDARPEAVLATTFTNRAAAELAERARATLLTTGEIEPAHRLHAARIGTVNGVCGGLVHDFAFEKGVSPRVSVLDEVQAQEMLLGAGAAELPTELLAQLEDLHLRLGLNSGGPRGFPGQAEWDWQQDVRQIVNLARANAIEIKQFEEFAERSIEGMLAFLSPEAVDGEALDQALEDALRQFLEAVDLDADATKGTRTAYTLVNSSLRRRAKNLKWSEWAALASLAPTKKSKLLAEPVREAAAVHDRHPRLHADLRQSIRMVFAAAGFWLSAYQRTKATRGVIDFVDQEAEALDLLRNATVRERLREEVDLVLVDEFQDTSPIQLAIFLELAKVAPRSVWVGDPKQAIYGFRGADPALMEAAVDMLLGGDPPETLSLSYRSRPGLVRLTSELFAPIFAESGIREELVRIEPGRDTEPAGLGPLLERWVLEPGINEKTGRPRANAQLDLISLAAGVCELLEDLEARVRDQVSGEARAVQPGDVAVLCFRNDQCTGLARELEARGVRAVVGRPGLANTLEAKLALAALRLWIDPRDILARAELARWLEHADDGEAWLGKVLEAEDRATLFSDLAPVAALSKEREPRAFAGVLAAFDGALAAAGVRERVVTFGDATARLGNLDALRALAAVYVETCRKDGAPCSLRGLLVHLKRLAAEGEDSQAAAERPDAVRICTLHASKGLEWPVTVLADLTDRPDANPLGACLVAESDAIDLENPLAGRWIRYWPRLYGRRTKNIPFMDRLGEDVSTEAARAAMRRESLRLIYVGWTRARDRLVYAARPDRIQEGGLSVLKVGGVPLVSEPDASGNAVWGVAEAPLNVTLVVRNLSPVPLGGGGVKATDGYVPSGPIEHPPATVSPSSLHAAGQSEGSDAQGEGAEAQEIGGRISVSTTDEEEMRRFGDAVHGFLAADRIDRARDDRLEMAQRLLEGFGVGASVDPAALLEASERLVSWVESKWPGAVWRREWPLEMRLDGGSVLRGIADLVLETDSGLVVIDHKSFPGSRDQAVKRAASYFPSGKS